MNIRTTSCILLLLMPPALFADFDSASQAYQNQDYRTAFAEFSELAEAGDARSQTVLAIMYKYGEYRLVQKQHKRYKSNTNNLQQSKVIEHLHILTK